MFGWELSFNKPWWLLLLAALPCHWLLSFRSLSGLGVFRRAGALALRSLVVLAFALALAEVQLVRVSERLTVIYLLDQSQSIPLAERQAMMKYVVSAFETHRHRSRRDRAGVIVFGADAKIELAPDTELATVGSAQPADDSPVRETTAADSARPALGPATAQFSPGALEVDYTARLLRAKQQALNDK